MTVAATIAAKLTAAFAPSALEVVDDSHRHAGHAGASPAGETHFHVRIVAAAFEGQSRVARQRALYKALAAELAGPVHALALEALTPAEAELRESGS
jgi:BolA protein